MADVILVILEWTLDVSGYANTFISRGEIIIFRGESMRNKWKTGGKQRFYPARKCDQIFQWSPLWNFFKGKIKISQSAAQKWSSWPKMIVSTHWTFWQEMGNFFPPWKCFPPVFHLFLIDSPLNMIISPLEIKVFAYPETSRVHSSITSAVSIFS